MKIGIVIGSIREGRKAEAVAHWVHDEATTRGDHEYELIDLKAFDVPPLTAGPTPPAAAKRTYDSPNVTRWSEAIDACEALIFVTPEYNHGVPGALKNAVDSIGPEWIGKTIAFVSYGAAGGIRAVEQWRSIVANFQMLDVRAEVSLSTFTDFDETGFAPVERRQGELKTLLDQLTSLAERLHAS